MTRPGPSGLAGARGGGSRPEASVVVPCRDHAAALERCLLALADQEGAPSYEVVVVDVGGDPAVPATMARALPDARVLEALDGLAPGEARNAGAGVARGRMLAFTDADCRPEPGWLAAAARGLASGARVVGGPVLDAAAGGGRLAAPGGIGDRGRRRGGASAAGASLTSRVDNLLQFAEFVPGRGNGPATHFPGCNVAIRREDFEEMGGFPDARLGEDLLFCRAARERWPGGLRFRDDMRVRHEGRGGFSAMCAHHAGFGYWRGRLGLRIGELQRRVGVYRAMVLPLALWRYAFLLRTTLRWRPGRLPLLLGASPLILAGLVSWARGFRRGLRDAAGTAG